MMPACCVDAVLKALIDALQAVYRTQGVAIHDKHIEIIIRQMLRRGTVIDAGSTDYLPGTWWPRVHVASMRRCVPRVVSRRAARPDHGHRQGLVATESWRRLLPGDDPCHGRCDQQALRPAHRSQGERDHR